VKPSVALALIIFFCGILSGLLMGEWREATTGPALFFIVIFCSFIIWKYDVDDRP
jgi:hypothetical protein